MKKKITKAPNMPPMTVSPRTPETSEARALMSKVAVAAKIRHGKPVSLAEIAKYSYNKDNPTPTFLERLEKQLEQPLSLGYISRDNGLYVLTGEGHQQAYGDEVYRGQRITRGAKNRLTQFNVGTSLALGKRDLRRKYGTI